MVIIACGLIGLAFLVVVGAIRFHAGNHNNEIPDEPAVEEVAVDDEFDGETDSQLRGRYLRDDMGEVSDPELWHRLRYGMVILQVTHGNQRVNPTIPLQPTS